MVDEYLQILGLQRGASDDEVKRSFRQLAKRYHPDKNKTASAKQNFLRVHEAYRFLLDVGTNPIAPPAPKYEPQPQADPYEEWKERARAYAFQKAKEAEEEQRKILLKFYQLFNYLALGILAFNLLLTLDYVLPRTQEVQQLIDVYKIAQKDQVGNYAHMYNEFQFERITLQADEKDSAPLLGQQQGEIHTTCILGKLLFVRFSLPNEIIDLSPANNIYRVFVIIVPVMFLLILGYRFTEKRSHNKLTFAIAIFFISAIQFYLFTSY